MSNLSSTSCMYVATIVKRCAVENKLIVAIDAQSLEPEQVKAFDISGQVPAPVCFISFAQIEIKKKKEEENFIFYFLSNLGESTDLWKKYGLLLFWQISVWFLFFERAVWLSNWVTKNFRNQLTGH